MASAGGQSNPFRKLWSLGFRTIIPIVPPGAEIAPDSDLAKRRGALGKAPGVLNGHGTWKGFPWRNHETTAAELDLWSGWGANAGLRTGIPDEHGDRLIGIDVDCMNPTLAAACEAIAFRMLGAAPVRIGRAPKRMLVYRTVDDIPYARVAFADSEAGATAHHVELSSRGRQFVAAGIHPDTGKRYSWTGLIPFAELPAISSSQLAAFLTEIGQAMPGAIDIKSSALEQAPANQALLRASDWSALRAAVAALPNRRDLFPTRDSYVDVAYAIRAAAGPEHEVEARETFVEWAMRYDGSPPNDEDSARSDFDRCVPPYRIGAKWLFEQARAHGGFNDAALWFDELPDLPVAEPTIWDEIKEDGEEDERVESDDIGWIDHLTDWAVEPPPQEWVVKGWIPRKDVTILYGDGGTGKTLTAQQLATACATGSKWLGMETTPMRVMMFLCEDDSEELQRRQIDINRHYGVTMEEVMPNLKLASRRYFDNALATWGSKSTLMQRTKLLSRIIRDAKAFGAGMVVIDTLADVFTGNEADRAQVRQFIRGALGRIAQAIDGCVLALGHPSLTGLQQGGRGSSGSTAWVNTARSQLYLERVEKGGPQYRTLSHKKSNYSMAGSELRLRWDSGVYTVTGTRMVGAGAGAADDGTDGPILPVLDDVAQQAVLEAIAAASDRPMSLAPQSRNYAPRVLKLEPTLDALSTSDIESALRALVRRGHVVEAVVGKDNARRPVRGLCIVNVEDDPFDG